MSGRSENPKIPEMLTDEQWEQFEQKGYCLLGATLTDGELAALRQRINDIMLGKADLDYDKLGMQRDPGEGHNSGVQSDGFKGASLNYRKIQNLEIDALFLTFMQKPLFHNIARRAYGYETNISCFRAMFMNKPAKYGTSLQYHQDRWSTLDRHPIVTIWTALDPSTKQNGCLQIFPGSHREVLNPGHDSGFLTEAQMAELTASAQPVYLEMKPGESVLLHNWTIHGSDGNKTDLSRRAFSVCYMDSDTRASVPGLRFPVIFGDGALTPRH